MQKMQGSLINGLIPVLSSEINLQNLRIWEIFEKGFYVLRNSFLVCRFLILCSRKKIFWIPGFAIVDKLS